MTNVSYSKVFIDPVIEGGDDIGEGTLQPASDLSILPSPKVVSM